MSETKPLQPVHIRGLSPEVWKAIRMEAVRHDWTVATLIERMWQLWRMQQGNHD